MANLLKRDGKYLNYSLTLGSRDKAKVYTANSENLLKLMCKYGILIREDYETKVETRITMDIDYMECYIDNAIIRSSLKDIKKRCMLDDGISFAKAFKESIDKMENPIDINYNQIVLISDFTNKGESHYAVRVPNITGEDEGVEFYFYDINGYLYATDMDFKLIDYYDFNNMVNNLFEKDNDMLNLYNMLIKVLNPLYETV